MTILRIIRDTKLAKQIKELYDYACQICQLRISVIDIPYAEAGHIKRLGKPHHAHDTSNNLICLCPNHHVMLDKGIFAINPDLTLVGITGALTFEEGHVLDQSNLAYHKEHIYTHG